MKTCLALAISALFLSSCIFEVPFESEAKIPVNTRLIGRWEEVKEKPDATPNRMLVLQNTANEYIVEYPVGEKAMFFRAFGVELEGGQYIQIQLIGSAENEMNPKDRKYHLLKINLEGDSLEMRTINADLLGKDIKDIKDIKTARA